MWWGRVPPGGYRDTAGNWWFGPANSRGIVIPAGCAAKIGTPRFARGRRDGLPGWRFEPTCPVGGIVIPCRGGVGVVSCNPSYGRTVRPAPLSHRPLKHRRYHGIVIPVNRDLFSQLEHHARCGCVFTRLPLTTGTVWTHWDPCCQHVLNACRGTFPVGWPPRFTHDPQPVTV